ncbi:MAG: hypothetical protein ACFE8V_16455 [Promethearchaeota archaeon]
MTASRKTRAASCPVGIWVLPESVDFSDNLYVQFLADGTLRVAADVERLASLPIATGTFWFEGTVFNTNDTQYNVLGKYEVRLVQQAGQTIGPRWKVIEALTGRDMYYRGLTPRVSGQ